MKRLLSLLFVFIVVLAGCGKSTEGSSETITLVVKDLTPSNEVHLQYVQAIEDGYNEMFGTNVDIELLETPSGGDSYAETMALMVNSGTIPDVMYWQGGDQAMAEQGIFEDLTPYVENSTYIKQNMYEHDRERLENYPYLLNIQPISGGIPVTSTVNGENQEVKDLIANPSAENYQKAFQSLVDNNSYETGISIAGQLSELDVIFDSAFGIENTWMQDENGNYQHKYVTENTRNKLEFYSQLYSQGLLDQNYLTTEWDAKEENFYTGKAATIVGSSPTIIDMYNTKFENYNDGTSIMTLPPAGDYYKAIDVSKETRGFAISSQAEDPQAAFNVLEFMASPEGQKLDRLGLEGTHYNTTSGKVEFTDEKDNWFPFFFVVEDPGWDVELAQPLYSDIENNAADMVDKYYKSDNNIVFPSEYLDEIDAVDNAYNEFAADVVTGKKSIDDFDSFVATFNEVGGEVLTQYANDNLE